MKTADKPLARKEDGLLGRIVAFCLQNKLITFLLLAALILWGLATAPFDWKIDWLPRNSASRLFSPVPVDAIPDIGENQQIVFTEWMGRSPQDIEDQITYPLTSALLGVPGVKTVRSFSMFGFSSIYVIFDENKDFYWSRTRVLEKLNSLPTGSLPEGVKPTLGPDATPLGQVFWYTLEGKDRNENPTGGWDLHELRSIQDWHVRYELLAVPGVSEVASVGGFVQEYQVDLDPDAMRAHHVTLQQVATAVRSSNLDIGARTLEINRVEYVIRGLGLVKTITDIEQAVVKATDNVPIRVRDVARVALGPALRRGALDKGGAEAVGGVVVVRYGANPLDVIKRVNDKIRRIAATLPEKTVEVRQPDGSMKTVHSQVSIVPFYDRTGLIHETLNTLDRALSEEILVTIIVVIVMLMHLRSSLLISGLLPLAVLMCFIAMKVFGVDANVVALSGIAIAIGTMVDMGIVLNENILKKLTESGEENSGLRVVYDATVEVGSAVLTAVATTVVSFLPVFTMEAAEGRLFKPLAWTKTYALVASLVVALTLIPPLAHILFSKRKQKKGWARGIYPAILLALAAAVSKLSGSWLLGTAILGMAFYQVAKPFLPLTVSEPLQKTGNWIAILVVMAVLTRHWMPLGFERGIFRNLVFVVGTMGGVLLLLYAFQRYYARILKWCLAHKVQFLLIPSLAVMFGLVIWMGFDRIFGFIPSGLGKLGVRQQVVRTWGPWSWARHAFPGLGKEFMPDLDEGSFLLMPTTMPHASIGEAMDVLRKQDMALTALPEIETVVGKIGRAESPLDPAPVSMIETVIKYKPEYRKDDSGKPVRQWRDHIKSPDDIWNEILRVTEIPGTTSAPKLQPIAARIVMLQSGMRAPMGIKIFGKGKTTLEDLEKVGIQMEALLKRVHSVKALSVNAERIVGKPYLEMDIDRRAIARYSVNITDVQAALQTAVGGMPVTTTVEGRERYNVLIRYKRELRDTVESLERILIPAGPMGRTQQIPLKELIKGGRIQYRRGPQVIKSEESALVTYVLFDKKSGYAEVDVKEDAERYLQTQRGLFSQAYKSALTQAGQEGRKLTPEDIGALPGLHIPEGITYKFAGTFENQVRSEKRLQLVLPLALFIIFIILYLQFKSAAISMLVFTGVFVAWSGGFIMIWLYSQDWFFNFSVFGVEMRALFQMHPINLSVAIWVGFLALFGIASDDGVVMATFLRQSFAISTPGTVEEIRDAVLSAGERRVRPCLMTTATTILALLPVLTSSGRGSDIMVPMAIPTFGGMIIELLTMFVVPVLFCCVQEIKLKARLAAARV